MQFLCGMVKHHFESGVETAGFASLILLKSLILLTLSYKRKMFCHYIELHLKKAWKEDTEHQFVLLCISTYLFYNPIPKSI